MPKTNVLGVRLENNDPKGVKKPRSKRGSGTMSKAVKRTVAESGGSMDAAEALRTLNIRQRQSRHINAMMKIARGMADDDGASVLLVVQTRGGPRRKGTTRIRGAGSFARDYSKMPLKSVVRRTSARSGGDLGLLHSVKKMSVRDTMRAIAAFSDDEDTTMKESKSSAADALPADAVSPALKVGVSNGVGLQTNPTVDEEEEGAAPAHAGGIITPQEVVKVISNAGGTITAKNIQAAFDDRISNDPSAMDDLADIVFRYCDSEEHGGHKVYTLRPHMRQGPADPWGGAGDIPPPSRDDEEEGGGSVQQKKTKPKPKPKPAAQRRGRPKKGEVRTPKKKSGRKPGRPKKGSSKGKK